MVKHTSKKNIEADLRMILSMLRDIDLKTNHIFEKLKSIHSYLDSINSSINSKL